MIETARSVEMDAIGAGCRNHPVGDFKDRERLSLVGPFAIPTFQGQPPGPVPNARISPMSISLFAMPPVPVDAGLARIVAHCREPSDGHRCWCLHEHGTQTGMGALHAARPTRALHGSSGAAPLIARIPYEPDQIRRLRSSLRAG